MYSCRAGDYRDEVGAVSMNLEPKSMAMLSACEQYRYHLYRRVADTGNNVCFVMLNPSTADASKDDATIRRCVGYAKRWRFGALNVVNLFAYRTTSPSVLRRMAAAGVDVVGPHNNNALLGHAVTSNIVVCAWGTNGSLLGREKAERTLELERLAGKMIEPGSWHPQAGACSRVAATGHAARRRGLGTSPWPPEDNHNVAATHRRVRKLRPAQQAHELGCSRAWALGYRRPVLWLCAAHGGRGRGIQGAREEAPMRWQHTHTLTLRSRRTGGVYVAIRLMVVDGGGLAGQTKTITVSARGAA